MPADDTESEPFADAMRRLTGELGQHVAESQRLDATIRANMTKLGSPSDPECLVGKKKAAPKPADALAPVASMVPAGYAELLDNIKGRIRTAQVKRRSR